jgi:putative flippase GtrA
LVSSLLANPLVAKLARYAVASMVGVVVGQSCLFLFYGALDLNGVLSNVLAVAISSVPAYIVNRYWVWKKTDSNSLRREIVPFWGMAFLGLVLSSLAVAVVDDRTDWPPAIAAANLAGFGVLWIAKFFVLDKVLFAGGGPEHAEPPPLL